MPIYRLHIVSPSSIPLPFCRAGCFCLDVLHCETKCTKLSASPVQVMVWVLPSSSDVCTPKCQVLQVILHLWSIMHCPLLLCCYYVLHILNPDRGPRCVCRHGNIWGLQIIVLKTCVSINLLIRVHKQQLKSLHVMNLENSLKLDKLSFEIQHSGLSLTHLWLTQVPPESPHKLSFKY